jgi:hypothetical protein
MIESALHFSAGMFGVSSFQEQYKQVIMIESEGFNNTLAPWENCPGAESDAGKFSFPHLSIVKLMFHQPPTAAL